MKRVLFGLLPGTGFFWIRGGPERDGDLPGSLFVRRRPFIAAQQLPGELEDLAQCFRGKSFENRSDVFDPGHESSLLNRRRNEIHPRAARGLGICDSSQKAHTRAICTKAARTSAGVAMGAGKAKRTILAPTRR